MTIQVLDCSACGKTLRFDMDFSQDGNHEITCPACGHVHYRVVEGGKITGIRYRSSMQTYQQSYVTVYNTAAGTGTFDTYYTGQSTGPATMFIRNSWASWGTTA